MDIRRRQKTLEKDKNLVAEQPGLFIAGIGLLFSFMVGFSIRGLIQPQRVQNLISQAASHIHNDLQIKFASAEVSLTLGGVPRFSVIIKDVLMTSENSCWMRPRLSIDEMELPIRVSALWGQQDPVIRLKAKQVKLTLAEAQRSCVESLPGPKPTEVTKSQSVSLKPVTTNPDPVSTHLEQIEIEKLEVDPLYWPTARTEFEKIELNIKSHQPKLITLKAKINSLKDQLLGDYSAHSQIAIDYSEFPERKAQVRVIGHWREGTFSWLSVIRPDDNFIQTDIDLKHIPISRLSLINDRPEFKKLESFKNLWVSGSAKSIGEFSQLQNNPLEVRNLKLDSDSGDLQVEKISWAKLSDPHPGPFLLQINKLSLQTLLKLFTQYKSSPHLSDLGYVSGRIDVESAQKVKFIGELSGLQFIFSNRGQRAYQDIQKVNLEISKNNGKWFFEVNRLEPKQGVFNGDLTATSDEEFKKVKIKMVADELSFSPQIQKLMTDNGRIGSIQTQMNIVLDDGVLNYMQGSLYFSDLKVDEIEMSKFKFNIETDNQKNFQAQIEMPEIKLDSIYKKNPLVSEWYSQIDQDQNSQLILKNFKSQLQFKNLQEVKWKSFSFAVPPASTIQGQATWDSRGQIQGQARIRTKNKNMQFAIEGDRDQPKVIKQSL